MYRLNRKQNLQKGIEYILISNKKIGNTMKIYPSYGGSIQYLTLKDKTIIKEDNESDFKEKFSSSILFPYANRVENGTFSFQGKDYQLPLNEVGKKSAIHGLIYDKKFEIIDYCLSKDKAFITLSYSSKSIEESSLFNYRIDLNYEIGETSLSLTVKISNIGKNPFPFSLGWHPYFYNKQIENRKLDFESHKKIVFNPKMIPCSVQTDNTRQLTIDRHFDDCYKLSKGEINYSNKDYQLLLTCNSEVNYLQVFTPEDKNNVAIEFMTSPPNSLNTKEDIIIMNPKDTYDHIWSIHLTKS